MAKRTRTRKTRRDVTIDHHLPEGRAVRARIGRTQQQHTRKEDTWVDLHRLRQIVQPIEHLLQQMRRRQASNEVQAR